MICKLNDAFASCDKYRDEEGFCTRNCSCSGMSFAGATQAVRNAAREEANAACLTRYNILTGKCGDWYIVPIDEIGRLI